TGTRTARTSNWTTDPRNDGGAVVVTGPRALSGRRTPGAGRPSRQDRGSGPSAQVWAVDTANRSSTATSATTATPAITPGPGGRRAETDRRHSLRPKWLPRAATRP